MESIFFQSSEQYCYSSSKFMDFLGGTTIQWVGWIYSWGLENVYSNSCREVSPTESIPKSDTKLYLGVIPQF